MKFSLAKSDSLHFSGGSHAEGKGDHYSRNGFITLMGHNPVNDKIKKEGYCHPFLNLTKPFL